MPFLSYIPKGSHKVLLTTGTGKRIDMHGQLKATIATASEDKRYRREVRYRNKSLELLQEITCRRKEHFTKIVYMITPRKSSSSFNGMVRRRGVRIRTAPPNQRKIKRGKVVVRDGLCETIPHYTRCFCKVFWNLRSLQKNGRKRRSLSF